MGKGSPSLGAIVAVGPAKTIRFLKLADDSEPARDFLRGISRRQKAKVAYRFREMSQHGRIHRQKFKAVEGSPGIYEFKAGQVRVLCFMDTLRNVVLVDGCLKKGWKLPIDLVRRVERLHREYLLAVEIRRTGTSIH